MKILIGYDGSVHADAVLLDLKRAGLRNDVEALILSAADIFLPPKTVNQDDSEIFPEYVPHTITIAREHAQQAFEKTEAMVTEAGKKIQQMFPNWTISTEAVADTPHWAIIGKAEDWNPDLIIVGSHGRTALGRAFFGSVSQKVVYEAKCSVRIARRHDLTKDAPIKLVLGTDGSADAEAMIETVASRNWIAGTEAKVVTSIENIYREDIDSEKDLDRIRDFQFAAVDKLTKSGLVASSVLTHEDPKHFLVHHAEKWRADCIFLGAKGHRFFERLLLGSVSSTVAARAHCSVEVVRKS